MSKIYYLHGAVLKRMVRKLTVREHTVHGAKKSCVVLPPIDASFLDKVQDLQRWESRAISIIYLRFVRCTIHRRDDSLWFALVYDGFN